MAEKKVKNLFIDANIWLSLFHFSNDDLEQFKKLKELIGEDIRLLVPEQIRNEVYRNRENKIKDALNRFEQLDLHFPTFFRNYEQYEGFYQEYKALKKQHGEWIKKVKEDITNQSTPADVVLKEFFASVEILSSTPEIVQRGVLRYNIGNPPGKDKKYGDAINWETLLECAPDGEDLFFVSGDADYASVLDDKQFNSFLMQEWKSKKSSKIVFYKSLTTFLQEHFKDIELREESEKDSLIEELSCSVNYKTTHRIIGELSNHSDFSVRQIRDICAAAQNNGQVGRILSDYDVHKFFSALLRKEAIQKSKDEAVLAVQEELQKLSDMWRQEEEDRRDAHFYEQQAPYWL